MAITHQNAGQYRVKFANYLARLCSGDLTLINEIIHTNQRVSPEAREVMLQDVPRPDPDVSESTRKRVREENLLLDIEERKLRLEERKLSLAEKNHDFQYKRIRRLEEQGMFDDRDRLYFKDILKKSGDPGYARIQDTNDERGREISIALVCQEMEVNPNGKSSQIGRLMARRWRELHPGEEIPKRDTLYMGRPYRENAYYQRDYALMQQCICEVLDLPPP